jgi:hypothetical protein
MADIVSYCGTQICGPGMYHDAHPKATGGLHFRSGALCVPCAHGRFKHSSGNNPCQSCPAGKFAPTSGSKVCTECPSGYFGLKNALKLHCMPCPAGRFRVLNKFKPWEYQYHAAMRCKACKAGMYQNHVGQGSCKSCRQPAKVGDIVSTCLIYCCNSKSSSPFSRPCPCP